MKVGKKVLALTVAVFGVGIFVALLRGVCPDRLRVGTLREQLQRLELKTHFKVITHTSVNYNVRDNEPAIDRFVFYKLCSQSKNKQYWKEQFKSATDNASFTLEAITDGEFVYRCRLLERHNPLIDRWIEAARANGLGVIATPDK